MCLAIPAKLIELKPADQAVVDLGGIRKEISVALVPGVAVGDYVIVHVGHAIGQIDPVEAERTLAMFGEVARLPASSGAALS
ncbi:MAG: HypC/HybG/HupF family hydrogenase formation chaperone [Methylibium sp.]|uniref:HypC/HybG/HupF family hydrogenase formation chaperone n=1 Tax=Methylibium sp. TaxID=2067992 RepID=UPI00274D16A1|nr:HypC/HybG/HupF family hydrogenase formation chaperone [Methylibium sp.]